MTHMHGFRVLRDHLGIQSWHDRYHGNTFLHKQFICALHAGGMPGPMSSLSPVRQLGQPLCSAYVQPVLLSSGLCALGAASALSQCTFCEGACYSLQTNLSSLYSSSSSR